LHREILYSCSCLFISSTFDILDATAAGTRLNSNLHQPVPHDMGSASRLWARNMDVNQQQRLGGQVGTNAGFMPPGSLKILDQGVVRTVATPNVGHMFEDGKPRSNWDQKIENLAGARAPSPMNSGAPNGISDVDIADFHPDKRIEILPGEEDDQMPMNEQQQVGAPPHVDDAQQPQYGAVADIGQRHVDVAPPGDAARQRQDVGAPPGADTDQLRQVGAPPPGDGVPQPQDGAGPREPHGQNSHFDNERPGADFDAREEAGEGANEEKR